MRPMQSYSVTYSPQGGYRIIPDVFGWIVCEAEVVHPYVAQQMGTEQSISEQALVQQNLDKTAALHSFLYDGGYTTITEGPNDDRYR